MNLIRAFGVGVLLSAVIVAAGSAYLDHRRPRRDWYRTW